VESPDPFPDILRACRFAYNNKKEVRDRKVKRELGTMSASGVDIIPKSFFQRRNRSQAKSVMILDDVARSPGYTGSKPYKLQVTKKRRRKCRKCKNCNKETKYITSDKEKYINCVRLPSERADLAKAESLGKKVFIRDSEGIDLNIPLNADKIHLIMIKDLDVRAYEKNSCQHIFFRGKEEHGQIFIAGKVARASILRIGFDRLQQYVRVLENAMYLKPNISRGDAKSPISDQFICFGNYRHRRSGQVASYIYKNSIGEELKEEVENSVKALVGILELKSEEILKYMPDRNEFYMLRDFFDFPIYSLGLSTQFCVGVNYWAPMHTDKDFFYTTLSCFSISNIPSEEVIQHFAFPEYKLVVPMRHGDVLVFDPRIKHCATSPRVSNCYIVSAYVSQNVITAHLNAVQKKHNETL